MGSTRSINRSGAAAIRFAAACLMALAPIAAISQTTGFIENRYLSATMFGGGQRDSINLTGRFEIIDRLTGTPILLASHIGDLGLNLNGSFITIRIDGGTPPAGTVGGTGWDIIMGDGSIGNGAWTWNRPPLTLNGRIFASGETGGGAPPIEVTTEIRLIGDMAQFRFHVFNRDSRPHTVGIRFAQDYEIAGFNDGPVVPNSGTQICTETELNGALVPSSWIRSEKPNFERNPALDPTLPAPSVGGLLRPRSAPPTFIAPDRFVIGNTFNLSDTFATQGGIWDWTPSNLPDFNFCRDSWDMMSLVYWNPRLLTPGQGMTIETYFGRNRATMDPETPLAVSLDAPQSLSMVRGSIAPSPFQITALAKNLSEVTLTNVTATLTLPVGLDLAPGESATKAAATLIPNGDAIFNWNVVPSGASSGRLTYSVAITAGPGLLGKSLTGIIEIPAASTNQAILLSNPSASGTGGVPTTFVNMISVPYYMQDPSPASGLIIRDDTGRQLSYSLGEFGLLRWNQRLGVYENVQFVRPGEAYWLVTRRAAAVACQQLTFRLDAQNALAVTTLSDFDLPLQEGWNQVGNPFVFALRFPDVSIVPTESNDPDRLRSLTIDQAILRGLIQPTIYEYDPRTCSYTPPALGTNIDLIPFRGYWIKAMRPGLRILFHPAIGRAAAVGRSSPVEASLGANGWALGIVARTESDVSAWNSFGVASGASDGPDTRDVEYPPVIAPRLSVAYPRADWPAGRAGEYIRDVQAADGRAKSWKVVVSTPQPNTEVTVTWPEISRVPRSYELSIVDMVTGQRRSMRQSSSLRVNTGAGASRAFTISAEPRRAGAVTISSLLARPVGRGTAAAISFVSSQDANVHVRILKSSGGLLRTLATRSAPAGETTVTWDLRDNKGVAVPSGAYTIEVKAVTTDGQSARQVAPYLVVR